LKTLKQHLRKLTKEQFKQISYMSYETNKLYNCALYVCNKYFEETNKYIGYNNLYHEIKTNIHYKNINNTAVAQQILRLLDKNFRSFFALLRRKQTGNYVEKINSLKFKKKGSQFIIIFPVNRINIKNGFLKLTKNIKIPFSYKLDGTLRQVIIKPYLNYFIINIQYEENKKETPILNKNNILGIDLGLNNLASCLSNIGTSLIVNGKPLKSYNQYWNKRKANIQSELELKNKIKWSKRLNRLSINRSNYVNNYLNQSVALIIKHCIENNIGMIICGYNETWKQDLNLGKVNNQNFSYIPFNSFKKKLEYKCQENGIIFNLIEESYTSKCSFLDNEDLVKKEEYQGKRIKRGLFKTNNGILCNADVQAAGNIIRKVVPNANFVDGIEGAIVRPKVLKIF
jgi:putative transposase